MADVVAVRAVEKRARPRAGWQSAVILEIVPRTPRISSIFLAPAQPFSFVPGQYLSVRVPSLGETRKYSIASAPESGAIVELAIEALSGGEVSGYFHRVATAGNSVEIRGPSGSFTWTASEGGPVLLIGGGSGLVPLMSMIRHRAAKRAPVPLGLIYSCASWDDVLFRDELLALAEAKDGFELMLTLTRAASPQPGWGARRIDRAMVTEMLARLPRPPAHVYLCGSDPFVDNAHTLVAQSGVPEGRIHTESYGV